jgi:hypothetical protein
MVLTAPQSKKSEKKFFTKRGLRMSAEENKTSSASLENLIEEAERDIAQGVKDSPKPCDHNIPAELKTKCPLCLWLFCDLCASTYDPKFCHNCIDHAPSIKIEDLVGEDGVKHNGKHIVPDPTDRFFDPKLGTVATIAKMKYTELETQITHFEALIKESELKTEHYRMIAGTMKLEKCERDSAEHRRLRAVPTPKPMQGPSGPKTRVPKAPSKSVPFSSAQLAQMVAFMASQKPKPKP